MASASRFCEVSEDEIKCLLESAIPEKTKNVLCKVFLLKQLDYSLSNTKQKRRIKAALPSKRSFL